MSPLFQAGFAFGICSVVAGVFVQGSFKKQVQARDALHAKEEADLRGASAPPPYLIRPEA